MGASFSPVEITDKNGAFKIGNLTPGTYRVDVHGVGLASRRLPRHDLKPGESWDMGAIELPAGARLTVHYQRSAGVDASAKPWFDLIDESGPYGGGGFIPDEKNPAASMTLRNAVAPGTYMLQIQGTAIAAAQMAVTLAADRENVVDVVLAPGVEQSFQIAKPKDWKSSMAPPRGTIRAASGGVVNVFDMWGSGDKPFFESRVSLAPGDYSFQVVTDAATLASGTFHVGAAAGPPIVK
jgi:hypothetical protein